MDPINLAFMAFLAIVPVIIALAMLSVGRVMWRLLAAVVLSFAFAISTSWLGNEDLGDGMFFDYLAMVVFSDATTIMMFIVVRAAGYRLPWRRARKRPLEEMTSESTPKAPFVVRELATA